ncbi:MAG: glycosyltransferase family 2 protein [Bdellovibrionales bacterium]|nr:glycosyltransferase family 2 protein [Bdellovibrionales bacterium]
MCAVSVLYHPSSGEIENCLQLASQVGHLVVVDNTPQPISLEIPKNLQNHVTLIQERKNLGMATALNQGANIALMGGYSWLLTMDQDSVLEPNAVAKLIEVAKYHSHPPVGLIAPLIIDSHTILSHQEIQTSDSKVFDDDFIVTSGSLINLKAYREIGGFLDDFFIDYVDHEYTLRLREQGWRTLLTQCARMHHQQGNLEPVRFLGKTFYTSNYPPDRWYYVTRNRLKCYHLHLKKNLSWIGQDFIAALREFGKMVLLEKDRTGKIFAIIHGIFDFMIGKGGPRRREVV